MATTAHPRYDSIGHGYAATRREEPRFRARILAALGSARTVVNVGAGAGSYEPRDRYVVAIEPSDVMAAQRPRELVPALRVEAHCLPLRDRSVDAAMSVHSLHHWEKHQEQGVRELRRVASGPVALLTCDPDVSGAMWLMADYLPEVAELDRKIFPSLNQVATWLGGTTRVEVVPIPRDTCDWMLMSFLGSPGSRARRLRAQRHVWLRPNAVRGRGSRGGSGTPRSGRWNLGRSPWVPPHARCIRRWSATGGKHARVIKGNGDPFVYSRRGRRSANPAG